MGRLPEVYLKCHCGTKLGKRNRFSIQLTTPKHINTKKRWNQYQYPNPRRNFTRCIIKYLCEDCYIKMYKNKEHGGWYINYTNSYPI